MTAVLASACPACVSRIEEPVANIAPALEERRNRAEIRRGIKKLEPFFRPMRNPTKGDWLATRKERGQTFDEFLDSNPTSSTQTLFLQPLDELSREQKKVVDAARRYIEIFFDVQVIERPTLSSIGSGSNRESRLKTTKVMSELLDPALPAEAGLLAVTTRDLYPDDASNYVFGQGSAEKRAGVWSLYRLDEGRNQSGFLLRTLKISTHEAGHIFGLRHCTEYECVMSGTNSLSETDRRPVDACPECSAKVWWLSGVDLKTRYTRLSRLFRELGFPNEANEFELKLSAMG